MGELLDQAVRLYRANFLKFIGIIALVEIPIGILNIISSIITMNGNMKMMTNINANPSAARSLAGSYQMLGGAGATIIVAILSFLLVSGVGMAALTRAIADGYTGETVDILGSYRKIGKSWGSLIGALLLVGLLSLGILIWTVIPCAGWLTGIGLLMFMSIVTSLLGPIIVLEKLPASAAVRRAWDLGRARFWWLIGYWGILIAFNILVVTGPVMLITLLVVSPLQREVLTSGVFTQGYWIALIAQYALSTLLGILYVTLQSTAVTLAYFDLRMRLEGFDLAVQTMSPEQSIVEQMDAAPSVAKSPKWITWKDVLNFFLLSLAGGALYGILMSIVIALSLGGTALSTMP
jgi:hypothetical protein